MSAQLDTMGSIGVTLKHFTGSVRSESDCKGAPVHMGLRELQGADLLFRDVNPTSGKLL
ncbi:hypothetical protein [Paenibacillus marinisediminis]